MFANKLIEPTGAAVPHRTRPLAWVISALAAVMVAMLTVMSVGVGHAQAAESKSIIEWFPNPYLATIVAGQLGKNLNEVVDQDELNTIKTMRATDAGGITTLAEFAPLHGLTLLDVQEQEVKDFAGLENFPLLDSLSVTNNPVETLAGIEDAPTLTSVSLGYNYAESFSGNVEALAPLEELPALRFLTFREAKLTDAHLEAVTLPETITAVNMNANEIQSVAPLSALSRVDTLSLADNKLTDISGISALTRLTSFNVSNNNFGQGHNEAVWGVGTNGIIDFSEVNLTPGTPSSRTLWMDRNTAAMEFEYLAEDDLYVYDLGGIKPPVSTTNKHFLYVVATHQGAVHNILENRIEMSPADYANVDVSEVVVETRFQNPLSILGRIWLYADEAAATYSVSYVDGVAEETIFADQLYSNLPTGSATPSFSGIPERAGYTFSGWNPAVSPAVTADTTYVAEWVANEATLSYRANGAQAGATAPVIGVTGGEVSISANGFVRPGYAFTGWNTAADGSGADYSVGSAVRLPAEGLELFAQWTPEVAVLEYHGNGATGGATAPVPGVTNGSVTVGESGFTREGYLFTGWNTRADGQGTGYATGSSVTLPAGGITLFAQWTAAEAALVFDGNGASAGTTDTITGVTGEAVTVAESGFTRDGYTFVGWNTQTGGSGLSHAAGTEYTLAAGVTTLFAQWTADEAALAFDGNEATGGDTATVVGVTDGEVTVADNGFLREGYAFSGWNTATDGSGVAYAAGDTFILPAGVSTLFAQWAAEDPAPEGPGDPTPTPTPEEPAPSPEAPEPAPEAPAPVPENSTPAPQVDGDDPAEARQPSGGLALTGANAPAWTLGAAALSLAGGLVFLLVRRRSGAHE